MTVSAETRRTRSQTKWSLLTVALCLLSLLIGRYTARPGSPSKPYEKKAQRSDKTVAKDLEVVTPYGPAITHSQGGYPPELIRRARKILNGDGVRVWDMSRDRPSRKLYHVSVVGGMEGTFLERDGTYVQVDSGSELIAINEILTEYRFTRQDFDSPQSVHLFLSKIIALQSGPIGLIPASNFGLKTIGPLADWLYGTEKDEAVLRKLFQDPQFVFDDDVWTVVFNVLRPNGAVDRWTVIGEHSPQTSTNAIWTMRRVRIKPPGTFSYPLIG